MRNDVSLPFESEEEQTSTKELLEVAVQLTAGISEAFEEMHKDKHSTSRIPVEEALRDLYDKEVTALLKWKEANGSKLGGKMTLQNQGVWEALQATVFNMTNLLSKISRRQPAKRWLKIPPRLHFESSESQQCHQSNTQRKNPHAFGRLRAEAQATRPRHRSQPGPRSQRDGSRFRRVRARVNQLAGAPCGHQAASDPRQETWRSNDVEHARQKDPTDRK